MTALRKIKPAAGGGFVPPSVPWMQTKSGSFPLINPTADDVVWGDLAAGLANRCRWAGQTTLPYSIAQHSIHVAELTVRLWSYNAENLALGITTRELRLYGLLHDGHEWPLGDLITPVKDALFEVGGIAAVKAMTALASAIDVAIHAKAGLAWPPPDDVIEAVKQADLIALATEKRDLCPIDLDWGWPLPKPDHRPIRVMPAHMAEDRFLRALNELIT